MVTKLQNKTSEIIDTQSITDMITVELSHNKKVQFVDKAAREIGMPDTTTFSFQGTAQTFQNSLRGLGILLVVAVLVIRASIALEQLALGSSV